MTLPPPDWHESNQRYLTAAVSVLREVLERHIHAPPQTGKQSDPAADVSSPARQTLRQAAEVLPGPSTLDRLSAAFRLSTFERDLLLLCAGMELDSGFAHLCAAAQNPARPYPTFSLALATLPHAHWSALSPTAPLRRWRLVEVGAGETLTTSQLRIDERVLNYLTGVSHLDDRLQGLVEIVRGPVALVPSHASLADRIVTLWSRAREASSSPVIQLCGQDPHAKPWVAAAACAALNLGLFLIRAADIPAAVAEREALARLWEREAVLSGCALVVDCEEVETPEHVRTAVRFAESVQSMILISSREPQRIRGRPTVRIDVLPPTTAEGECLWRTALGPRAAALDGQLEVMASQFGLSPVTIQAACAEALSRLPPEEGHSPVPLDDLAAVVWDACRVQARPRLDELAQRIESSSEWDDLVLPEPQRQTLREVAAQVRRRGRVYESWGFARRCSRGLGISALFAGPSGTGKTLAAEVLANELRLDLFRIDLSQVVSKYIGETEKNLRRVFDAAEAGGAILLFDEADALFGKRSEVKDSHDRYANIEVSYLLQRMEAYRGLAILTTNMKSALDAAFLRRIRFVIQFPFPDAGQRTEIWRRIFPPSTPTAALDFNQLARLNVAGGNIRNIALNAAFLAADEEQCVRMGHLLRAARTEYIKLEKTLPDAETTGWR